MLKQFFLTGIVLMHCAYVCAQKEVHILSVNDMHASIENMPRLAAVADSLRAIDPELIILSAGDNRTGNPLNDKYTGASLPITEMMNAIGFQASAIGNHEFDSKVNGLRNQINNSNFKYLCSNVFIPDSLRLNVYPYKFIESNGVKIGLLGAIQVNQLGIPDSHPNNLEGMKFQFADDVIPQYSWMRDKCDVLILLSHDGYEADSVTANKFPYFDAIIGGHSHTQIDGTDFQNGVMITQAKNKLKFATLSTFYVSDGKVVKKEAKLIDVAHFGKENEELKKLYLKFSKNPALEEIVAQVLCPFSSCEELAIMEMDALKAELNVDVAIQNGGGVRFDTFPVGPMRVQDILKLDPFGNEAIVYEMTGAELESFVMNLYDIDEKQIPYVSGMDYVLKIDKATKKPKSLKITNVGGKKFDKKATYTMATNSYAQAVSTSEKRDKGKNMFKPCSDYVLDWLRKQKSIDGYSGKKHVTVVPE